VSQHPLAYLKKYDAKAIAQHYNRRPWLAFWRLFQVVYMYVGLCVGLQWDKWTGQEHAKLPRRAEQLREIITKLGPTYIKVGQALSTRPDLVRKDFLDELAKLQDQLPPFPTEVAIAIIEKELGKSIDRVYGQISEHPVAAASLGQVYKGVLFTGEEVAIKVQRPNLIPTITLDLYVLRLLASIIQPFLPINLGADLRGIVDEFGTKLFEEVDYINEAKNAERFAAYFNDEPKVGAPSIYWRYSSKRVLTMEWIDGIKLTDVEGIKAAGLDINDLVHIGVMSGLRQLLEFGFFHADPHPGNLFATADGRMVYIDFGMMDQLEQTTKEALVDSVVHLLNKDYQNWAMITSIWAF
jgi:predicted unusual protein kinase regulating ubiquinone biosynthesis (AarF/ABC1/UbiB family)